MTKPTDWNKIIADLSRAGFSVPKTAALIGVPYSTLAGWRNGITTPTYETGRRLVQLWCDTCSKQEFERPKCRDSIG